MNAGRKTTLESATDNEVHHFSALCGLTGNSFKAYKYINAAAAFVSIIQRWLTYSLPCITCKIRCSLLMGRTVNNKSGRQAKHYQNIIKISKWSS